MKAHLQKVPLRQMEQVLKALANKRRLHILKYLERKPQATITDIAEELGLSVKATSRHVALLSNADLLDREQRSIHVHCTFSSAAPAFVKAILAKL